MKQLYYEWKIHFSFLYLVPVAILVIFMVNLWQDAANPYQNAQLQNLYYIFEAYWPLALALAVSTLLPQEYEAGMLSLRQSYPQSYKLSILQKLLLPLLWWVFVGVLAAGWAHQNYLAFNVWDMFVVALPPACFLAGLAILASALSLNSSFSMVITLCWWALDLTTGGFYTGNLTLLPYSLANTADIAVGENRVSLVILGLLFGYLALVYVKRTRKTSGVI